MVDENLGSHEVDEKLLEVGHHFDKQANCPAKTNYIQPTSTKERINHSSVQTIIGSGEFL